MPKSKKTSAGRAAAPRRSASAPEASPLLTAANRTRRGPLWTGPDGKGPNGGVTFGLLSRWLTCRERARLTLIEGLRPVEQFSAPRDFGNMWHACEEAHANGGNGIVSNKGGMKGWQVALEAYCLELGNRYPMQREQVGEWAVKCAALFPLYVEHWSRHDDVKNRTPLLAEQAFDVLYRLPSGRTVRLRGKWDSVDLVDGAVWLQENKTKGTIDRAKIVRQLTFDLQTMLYLVALQEYQNTSTLTEVMVIGKDVSNTPNMKLIKDGKMTVEKLPIKGVRYNVVRRSQHKTAESMLKKFEEDQAGGLIDEWFARWNVEVSAEDVARFRRRFLDPVLEQLCRWWDHVRQCKTEAELFGVPFNVDDGNETPIHWQSPFSSHAYGSIDGGTDLDECVRTGSEVGLRRVDVLFPELA